MKIVVPPPRISIVIPLFNAEKFIETCIKSILSQTFTDFEVIVVDDCSTDRSAEIVQSFDDSRVKLFYNTKQRYCDVTRNIGITIAQGDYIYFMDSDDAILPNMLETLITASDKSQAEVVIMNSLYDTNSEDFTFPAAIKVKKRYIKNPKPRFFSNDLHKRIQEEYRLYGVNWEPWTRIQRRIFLLDLQICFPDTRRAGDRLFHLAELCFAKKIQVIDYCGYVYRHHSKQTVKTSTENLLKIDTQLLQPAFRYIREIFASKNLISDLSREMRTNIKIDAMNDYFRATMLSMYTRGLSQERINEILYEVISQSGFDSEFVSDLINMLAKSMLSSKR